MTTLHLAFGDRPTALVVLEVGREPEVFLAGCPDGEPSINVLDGFLRDEYPAWHELVYDALEVQGERELAAL